MNGTRVAFVEVPAAEDELAGAAVQSSGDHAAGMAGDGGGAHPRDLRERRLALHLDRGCQAAQAAPRDDGQAHVFFRSAPSRRTITMASSSLSR